MSGSRRLAARADRSPAGGRGTTTRAARGRVPREGGGPAPVPSPPPVGRRATFLPFAPPLLGAEEAREVVDTLGSDWITTGPKTKRFERAFAVRLGAPDALALNSCTAGLHTALASLGVGPGDEVITTALTFAATVNVIEHVGARPVLVDVEPDALTIDPCRVAAAVYRTCYSWWFSRLR